MATHWVHRLRALCRRRGERGQAIIEFAMVLPLLCALVLIFVAFGKAIYYYIQFTHVANEGARFAAVNEPFKAGTNLKTYLCSQVGGPPASISVSYPNGTQNVGDPVTVTASTSYSWFPFMNLGALQINAAETMRLEQTPGSQIVGGSC